MGGCLSPMAARKRHRPGLLTVWRPDIQSQGQGCAPRTWERASSTGWNPPCPPWPHSLCAALGDGGPPAVPGEVTRSALRLDLICSSVDTALLNTRKWCKLSGGCWQYLFEPYRCHIPWSRGSLGNSSLGNDGVCKQYKGTVHR